MHKYKANIVLNFSVSIPAKVSGKDMLLDKAIAAFAEKGKKLLEIKDDDDCINSIAKAVELSGGKWLVRGLTVEDLSGRYYENYSKADAHNSSEVALGEQDPFAVFPELTDEDEDDDA